MAVRVRMYDVENVTRACVGARLSPVSSQRVNSEFPSARADGFCVFVLFSVR